MTLSATRFVMKRSKKVIQELSLLGIEGLVQRSLWSSLPVGRLFRKCFMELPFMQKGTTRERL